MAYVQVPPDGAGKKVYSKTQTVNADQVEAQVMHIADASTPQQLLAIDNQGAASVRFAEGQPILAGFGGVKIANERALGVYESSLDTYDTLFSIVTATGGAINYNPAESSEVLSVTGASGSSVSATTNRYHYYLPGSANVIKMTTACGDNGKVGNTRRWGAFDDNDGIFIELKDLTKSVVIRNSTSGSIVETRVNQADWNTDKLDGTGTSGVTLDITKIQVWWMDYQWLGAGRVRFGTFSPSGARLTVHVFENAGAHPLPYMRTGTLPLRAENLNTGTTGSSSELRIVCLSAYTEGTFEDYTYWRYADAEALGVSVTTATNLFSMRSKPTVNSKHNSVIIYPETLNVFCSDSVAIDLWQDTSVSGGTWSSLASTGDINLGGTVVTTAAQRFKTLYFSPGAHTVSLSEFFEPNDEGIQTTGTGSEVWSFNATRLTANATTVTLNLGYKELW